MPSKKLGFVCNLSLPTQRFCRLVNRPISTRIGQDSLPSSRDTIFSRRFGLEVCRFLPQQPVFVAVGKKAVGHWALIPLLFVHH